MYAIVRAGGRQEKVAVGDEFELDRRGAEPGEQITLPAVLLVDGEQVTSDATALAGVTVTAEILAHTKGPKIRVLHYRNKTGYKRRQGHRSHLTRVRVTDISAS